MSRRRAGRSTHEPEPEPDGPPTDAAAAAAAERQARWAKHPLHPGPDAPAGGEGGLLSGGLYPTVAVSDAFNAAAHGWAAVKMHEAGEQPAAMGFGLVAVAATVGTLRFGASERLLAQANGDLADLAAFVGLPLVGRSFALRWLGEDSSFALCRASDTWLLLAGAVVASLCRSLSAEQQELAKVIGIRLWGMGCDQKCSCG